MIKIIKSLYHRVPISASFRHRVKQFLYSTVPVMAYTLFSSNLQKFRKMIGFSPRHRLKDAVLFDYKDSDIKREDKKNYPNINYDSSILPECDLSALFGETIWHTLTLDPSIREESNNHFKTLNKYLPQLFPRGVSGINYLEVASYAHTTGYSLAKEMGLQVTLFDISANTLQLGSQIAKEDGFDSGIVRKVAGDFHSLPFDAGCFDVVYICSAVHHTLRWQHVVQEMIRVLAPGGVLFIDNEPCKRELCFYKFRTNRMNSFSWFENTLHKSELLRTVAEPYLGSRPETVFGMTENQQISLEQLISLIGDHCIFEEITLSPEICIESFELIVTSMLNKVEPAVSNCVEQQIKERLSVLKPPVENMARGEEFNIPTESEISFMAHKIGALASCVAEGRADAQWNPYLLPGVDEDKARRTRLIELMQKGNLSAQKIMQSRLFGAGVRIIGRKIGTHVQSETFRASRSISLRDEVEIAFPDHIRKMMDPDRSLFPIIQKDPAEKIKAAFGADWRLVLEGQFHLVVPIVSEPIVTIDTRGGKTLLVFFRCSTASGDAPWRLSILLEGRELCYFDVYQTESTVLAATIRTKESSLQLHYISRRLIPPNRSAFEPDMVHKINLFNISHCGAVILE
jgi:ubiquinone/menaquinone biosynthesis C-methylase UbiE